MWITWLCELLGAISWMKTITGVLYHSKIHGRLEESKNVGESLKGKGRNLGHVSSIVSSGTARIRAGILMRIILELLCL